MYVDPNKIFEFIPINRNSQFKEQTLSFQFDFWWGEFFQFLLRKTRQEVMTQKPPVA